MDVSEGARDSEQRLRKVGDKPSEPADLAEFRQLSWSWTSSSVTGSKQVSVGEIGVGAGWSSGGRQGSVTTLSKVDVRSSSVALGQE